MGFIVGAGVTMGVGVAVGVAAWVGRGVDPEAEVTVKVGLGA